MSEGQDGLPVKFQDVKFKYPKFKHEMFVRIDMKHSSFSNFHNLFTIIVEIIIELPKIDSLHNFCSCSIAKVTNLILYMYLFIEIF